MDKKYELAYFVFLIQEILGTDDLLDEYSLSDFLDAVAKLPAEMECTCECTCDQEDEE